MLHALLACFSLLVADPVADVTLPDPGSPVGHIRLDLETGQPDLLTEAPDDTRRLTLDIWYPAASAGPVRMWGSDGLGAALGSQFPLPSDINRRVHAHASEAVPVRDGRFPVLLFSHGLSFPIALYQSWTEGLAARGYVVIAVSHPHGVSWIDRADGTHLDMSAWPQIDDESEREHALAEQAGVWSADLAAVLDQVDAWNVNEWPSPLAGHIEAGPTGMMGHSFGGTAAGRLSLDPRIDAVVAMEGVVRDPNDPSARGELQVGAPLLHIIGGYNRLELDIDDYLPGPGAPVYRAVINGTGHANLSDLILIYSRFADASWHARHRYELAPERVQQISLDEASAFFDRYLKGKDTTPLLEVHGMAGRYDRPSVAGYPEVDLRIAPALPER